MLFGSFDQWVADLFAGATSPTLIIIGIVMFVGAGAFRFGRR